MSLSLSSSDMPWNLAIALSSLVSTLVVSSYLEQLCLGGQCPAAMCPSRRHRLHLPRSPTKTAPPSHKCNEYDSFHARHPSTFSALGCSLGEIRRQLDSAPTMHDYEQC